MVCHLLVGIAASASGRVVTIHAIAVTAVVLWLAVTSTDLGVLLACGAYVSTSEVFWRLPGSSVPWMWGTYLAIVVLVVGWTRLLNARVSLIPMAFVICLVPGVAIAVTSTGLAEVRERLAFNLSASILLAISWTVCSKMRSTLDGARILMAWFLAAALLVSGAALVGVTRMSALDFTEESNLATSAGFGPNQVSLTMGIGMVSSLLLAITSRRPSLRIIAISAFMLLVVQGVLTFSRTGPFLAVLGAIGAIVGYSRSVPRALLNLARGAVVLVIVVVMIGPWIESFTGGQASQRFRTAQVSHRDEIATADLAVFAASPLFGTGVGASPDARFKQGLKASPSHTEQTRLLAEHGVFGAAALVLILVMGIQAVRRQTVRVGRGWAVCWVVWAFAAMSVSANRVAVVPFAFGLAALLLCASSALDPPTFQTELHVAAPDQLSLGLRGDTEPRTVPVLGVEHKAHRL